MQCNPNLCERQRTNKLEMQPAIEIQGTPTADTYIVGNYTPTKKKCQVNYLYILKIKKYLYVLLAGDSETVNRKEEHIFIVLFILQSIEKKVKDVMLFRMQAPIPVH